MKLDSEQQRQILLQLIDNTQFPGKARRLVIELSQAIETAEIEEPQDAVKRPRVVGAD
jgi:hypothetical protein